MFHVKHKLLCVAVWLRVQLLVAAAACVAVEFLAVFERNVRKGLALHVERKPFGCVIVTPACAGLGSLVDDLLEQVGACLGECELAEARIDGSEVGVDDLIESVVLHDVSFHSAWRRVSVVFFPLAAAVSLVFLLFQRGWRCRFPACGVRLRFSLRFLPHHVSLFCCAFIIDRRNRRCHATIVDSFVFSSANLEINVMML